MGALCMVVCSMAFTHAESLGITSLVLAYGELVQSELAWLSERYGVHQLVFANHQKDMTTYGFIISLDRVQRTGSALMRPTIALQIRPASVAAVMALVMTGGAMPSVRAAPQSYQRIRPQQRYAANAVDP